MKKINLCNVHEIPLGKTRVFQANGEMILLIHSDDDRWFAVSELCPHRGGPLSEGKLCGTVITCPWHQAQFDVTGKPLGKSELNLRHFELEITSEEINLLPSP